MDKLASSNPMDDLPVYLNAILNAHGGDLETEDKCLLIRVPLGGEDPRTPNPLFTLARLEKMPAAAAQGAEAQRFSAGGESWLITFAGISLAFFRKDSTVKIPMTEFPGFDMLPFAPRLRYLAHVFSTGGYLRELASAGDLGGIYLSEVRSRRAAEIGLPSLFGEPLTEALPIPLPPGGDIEPGSPEHIEYLMQATQP